MLRGGELEERREEDDFDLEVLRGRQDGREKERGNERRGIRGRGR